MKDINISIYTCYIKIKDKFIVFIDIDIKII